MHRPPPPAPKRRSLVLPLLLILALVGLAAAIAHKRVRRLQIEGSRPAEIELQMNVSTQVMSFRVSAADTNNPPPPVNSLLMSVTPQPPPAPIIHSTPRARRESEPAPLPDPALSRGRPQEIVSE